MTYLYTKTGILSLSSKYYDLSMWSAYTNHTGFCVEFDISTFPFYFSGPYSIDYTEKLQSLSIKEIPLPIATLVQTNVKTEMLGA